MKKKLALLLILCLCVQMLPIFAGKAVLKNMLKNGTFENYSIMPWNAWGEMKISKGNAHTGNACLQVGNQSPDGGGGGENQFTLRPFGVYTFSVWGRYERNENSGRPTTVGFEYYDADGNMQEEKVSFTENEWTQKTITFSMPAYFENPMLIVWKQDTTQNFYMDDLFLAEEEGGEYTLVVDGKGKKSPDAKLVNGKAVMTPAAIAEATGAELSETAETIVLRRGKYTVCIKKAGGTWTVNGTEMTNTVLAANNGECLLHSIEIVNALNLWAGYSQENRILYISTDETLPVNRNENSPVVNYVSRVAPDILTVRIDQGKINRASLIPYEAQPGDRIQKSNYDNEAQIYKTYSLIRDEKTIGVLAGPEKNYLQTPETVSGDKLDMLFSTMPQSYVITDESTGEKIIPQELYLKSKVSGRGMTDGQVTMEHYIYLKLPKTLTEGNTYIVTFNGINVQTETVSFVADAKAMRSEAIHTNQVGHRPDDLSKLAYLSIWLGTGGNYTYQQDMKFHLIKDDTGDVVYTGDVQFTFDHAKPENFGGKGSNQTYTDVYTMDYSSVTAPGMYRLYIDNIGCSYPIEISDTAWDKAFTTVMKGFYHMRGSVDLGAPYSDFERPRDHHPDDGFKIYQSTCTLMDSGNGLNARGTDTGNFGNLIKGATDVLVPEAIGGYQDAGDWDRRIQHLEATIRMLDLLIDFPERLSTLTWNIPESDNDLPDIIDEAIFGVDFYKRLQTEDGGIRGGLEFSSHPSDGEPSWMDSQTGYVYAPDCYSSYYYVTATARLAILLKEYAHPEMAQEYLDSALRAMEWAETDYAKIKEDATVSEYAKIIIRDLRNAAALEIYIATGDSKWHDIFLADTVFTHKRVAIYDYNVHDQRQAAYRYARLDASMVNEDIQKNCRQAIVLEANTCLRFIENNAFNVCYERDPGQPIVCGYVSAPQGSYLAQAYVLTGADKFKTGLQKAAAYSAGANPMNKTFMVGLGYDYPRDAFKIDARITGQDMPIGTLIYGTQDLSWEHWANTWVYNKNVPAVSEWPNTEGFFDAYGVPMTEEWTVHQTSAQGAYTWGVLAGW